MTGQVFWPPNFIYGNMAGVAMSEKVDVCEGHNGNKVELPQFTEEHVKIELPQQCSEQLSRV